MVAIGPVVSEEKLFEIVDGRTTDGRRTTEPAYTISSPGAFGSGELKKKKKFCFVGGGGLEEVNGARVSEFFQRIQISKTKKYIYIFFFGVGGGGARVSGFFLQRIQILKEVNGARVSELFY